MKNNRGLTLIEVLVSLAIVFIVFLGISASGLLVLEENIKNSLRDEAVSVAEMDVQEARNLPFDGYALGLIAHSLLEVMARTFYAQQDTWTPLYVAIAAIGVAIVASFALRSTLGVGGLALANAIGATLEVGTLLIILLRRLSVKRNLL